MIYASDGRETHLVPETACDTLCGWRGWKLNGCSGPVTCPDCLTAAKAAFGWVLMHYADDVQSKATTQPVVPLGQIDQRGRRIGV